MKIKKFDKINESDDNRLYLVIAIPSKNHNDNKSRLDNLGHFILNNKEDAENYVLNSINEDIENSSWDLNFEDYEDSMVNGLFIYYKDANRWSNKSRETWTYEIEPIRIIDNVELPETIIMSRNAKKYNV